MYKILVSSVDSIPQLVSNYFEFVTDSGRNISLVLQNESQIYGDLKQEMMAKGVPIIGTSRFNKIEQTQILDRFGINYPESYYDVNTNGCLNSIDKLNAYCDLNEFVVKPILGARGVGVKLIKRNEFKDCLYSEKTINKVFSKEIEDTKSEDIDVKGYISNNIGCMLIQKPIKVKREFRVLYFAPDYILTYERELLEGQFCGNLSHGSRPKEVEDKFLSEDLKPFVNQFKPIMDEFKYPWISIDVYEDMDGKLGVFEFQMEFAYEGFNHKLVRERMKESLEHYMMLKKNYTIEDLRYNKIR